MSKFKPTDILEIPLQFLNGRILRGGIPSLCISHQIITKYFSFMQTSMPTSDHES